MTIAELLVQETGREMTAHCHADGCGCCAAVKEPVAYALEQARAIVAAVYGEPCEATMLFGGTGEFFDATVADRSPADECRRCGWPRSQHGARP